MSFWMIAAVAVPVAALAWLIRRRRAARHASFREDLFEGLLPSAVTGSPDRSPRSDGWGLRWAQVTNLTAADLAEPPRRNARGEERSPAAVRPDGAESGVELAASPESGANASRARPTPDAVGSSRPS